MAQERQAQRLRVDWFDGRGARARPVQIWLVDGELLLQSEDAAEIHRYAAARLHWPERQRHGQRQLLLSDGGVLSTADAATWDAWAAASGRRESLTVRWMQSWRHVALALALCLALLAAGWRWGVPLAADGVLALLPASAERAVGEQALQNLDAHLLRPSGLPAARQRELIARFEAAARRALPATGTQPAFHIQLRDGGEALGPNAFALPGGEIVLTDALAELLADRPDALVGVLAHELGHVQHRHGMRVAVQASLVASVTGLLVGDVSTVLAAVPAVLAQASYSRDFERQADAYAYTLMRGADLDPAEMAVFFERIGKKLGNRRLQLPIAIASHPADAERVRFFQDGPR